MEWSIEFGLLADFAHPKMETNSTILTHVRLREKSHRIEFFILLTKSTKASTKSSTAKYQLKLPSQSRTRTWERTNFHLDVEKLLSENAVSFSLHIMEIAKLCNLLAMAALKESVREENEFPALPAGDCLRCSAAERLRRREKNFLLAARRNVVH